MSDAENPSSQMKEIEHHLRTLEFFLTSMRDLMAKEPENKTLIESFAKSSHDKVVATLPIVVSVRKALEQTSFGTTEKKE